MDCLLCLELETEPENGLQLCSPSSTAQNVKRLIETHLRPMTMFRSESQWLCSNCWHILQEFHKFYLRIERGHKDLHSRVVKSECHLQDSKDLNLFQPEIVLEQPIAFIKQECKETETDYDDLYKDEEANADPTNNTEYKIKDTQLKKEKTIKRRKTHSVTNDLAKPDVSDNPNDTSTNALVTEGNEDCNSQ